MMGLKASVNKLLGSFGLALVRRDTVARLEAMSAGAQSDSPNAPLAAANTAPLRRALAKKPNVPPRRCTDLAPVFEGDDTDFAYAANARAYQAEGVTILKGWLADPTSWSMREVFENDVGNRNPAWDWAGNSREPYSTDLNTGLPSEALQTVLIRRLSSPDTTAFFHAIVGCDIEVGNCRLVRSHVHEGDGIGPQSWHQDGTPAGVIRGIVYLTDVDARGGPFQYLDADGQPQSVTGKAGDMLVFDAMRLRHRGSPPLDHERKAIDLVFMPRMPGQPMRLVVAGMNHWPADPMTFSYPVGCQTAGN